MEERGYRRIARLVRQIQELQDRIRQLLGENDRLEQLVDNYERKLSRVKEKDNGIEVNGDGETYLKFKTGTVLFADIRGFSKLAEQVDVHKMMDELDGIFIQFDSIVRKFKLQKLKTIGDSYMCVGGVPERNSTNPIEVIMAALEMFHFLGEARLKSVKNSIWDIRIGVHTGQVTALANGKKKMSWDIKGDTINIASRLSASCTSGRINISANTYELVKEFFDCEYNGKIPVKYLGNLSMYYVNGIIPQISAGGLGILPDENFDIKFKLVRFIDLEEAILDRLEKELPSYLYYHDVKHTIDVVTEVELIGWAEGVNEEEILLLKSAALFHDSGHIMGYDEHELHSCGLAREYLPGYGYSAGQIGKICELIMATKLPPEPKNLLEKIICDSDLDYLGRSDFIPVSNTLYEELREQNKIGSLDEWNRMQIRFISSHQYFTKTARSLREINKQKQIERIRSIVSCCSNAPCSCCG
jgi:adenylate cyclase